MLEDVEFEWDPQKAERVLLERGIAFERVIGLFATDHVIARSDKDGEERWRATGIVEGNFVTVVFTRRGSAVRIIPARRAWTSEERQYRAHVIEGGAEHF